MIDEKKDILKLDNAFSKIINSMSIISNEEAKKRDEEIKKYEAENLRKARESMYRNCGIAEKFENVELYDLVKSGIAEMRDKDGKLITDIKVFEDFIADIAKGKPRALLVFGDYGTGKSVFSVGILHELCRKGVSSGYFKAHEVMQRIDDAKWHCSNESRKGIINEICSPQFRVIDEIGRYPDSKNEQFVLFDVTNRCYENYKSSIYISNLTKKELAEFMGGAVIDRFKGFGMTIEFSGKSFRGTEKELYIK